jgi:hypothetical protein
MAFAKMQESGAANSENLVAGSGRSRGASLVRHAFPAFAKTRQTVWKVRQSDSLAACAALVSDMTHIFGFERSQLLLLPEAIDDYVVADNPVRFIDAFVDGLDLAAAGFKRVTPKVTGRPGYAPGDLLKLYIYGYLKTSEHGSSLGRSIFF